MSPNSEKKHLFDSQKFRWFSIISSPGFGTHSTGRLTVSVFPYGNIAGFWFLELPSVLSFPSWATSVGKPNDYVQVSHVLGEIGLALSLSCFPNCSCPPWDLSQWEYTTQSSGDLPENRGMKSYLSSLLYKSLLYTRIHMGAPKYAFIKWTYLNTSLNPSSPPWMGLNLHFLWRSDVEQQWQLPAAIIREYNDKEMRNKESIPRAIQQ